MFDAEETSVMEVPGVRESANEVVGFPKFPTQLANLLMRFPELSV